MVEGPLALSPVINLTRNSDSRFDQGNVAFGLNSRYQVALERPNSDGSAACNVQPAGS